MSKRPESVPVSSENPVGAEHSKPVMIEHDPEEEFRERPDAGEPPLKIGGQGDFED